MFRYFLLAAALVLTIAALRWLFHKPTPAEKLARYERKVQEKGGKVFQTELQGKAVAFLVQGCKVYLLDASGDGVKEKHVLSPGFYPWFTVCTGQSLRQEGGYVIAHLSNRAIGAGGGNTSGGEYRTKDGEQWQKHTGKGWVSVEEAQAG